MGAAQPSQRNSSNSTGIKKDTHKIALKPICLNVPAQLHAYKIRCQQHMERATIRVLKKIPATHQSGLGNVECAATRVLKLIPATLSGAIYIKILHPTTRVLKKIPATLT